jgi:GST-like protein
MRWPWFNALPKFGVTLDSTPSLQRWHAEIGSWPAVQLGLVVPVLRERAAA